MLIESIRSVQQTNGGSLFIVMPKTWTKHNKIKKQNKIKMLSGESITILIAPNSPLNNPDTFEKLKQEIAKW